MHLFAAVELIKINYENLLLCLNCVYYVLAPFSHARISPQTISLPVIIVLRGVGTRGASRGAGRAPIGRSSDKRGHLKRSHAERHRSRAITTQSINVARNLFTLRREFVFHVFATFSSRFICFRWRPA